MHVRNKDYAVCLDNSAANERFSRRIADRTSAARDGGTSALDRRSQVRRAFIQRDGSVNRGSKKGRLPKPARQTQYPYFLHNVWTESEIAPSAGAKIIEQRGHVRPFQPRSAAGGSHSPAVHQIDKLVLGLK